VDLQFLDDTGSESFDIFENPDLQTLQIPPWPVYWYRNQWTQVITAGGVVFKEQVLLQVRLLDTAQQPVGPWAVMPGVINPGITNHAMFWDVY